MILECRFIYVWESLCYVNGRTCSSNGMCKKYFNLLFSGFKWMYSWFTILWINGEDLCFKKMTNSKSHSRWKNWRVLGLEKMFLSQMGYAFMVESNEQKEGHLHHLMKSTRGRWDLPSWWSSPLWAKGKQDPRALQTPFHSLPNNSHHVSLSLPGEQQNESSWSELSQSPCSPLCPSGLWCL